MNNYNFDEGRWRIYAFSLIAVFVFILSLKWTLIPTFIDIYYHLTVMLGFNEAGGFTTTAFWEYAPVGRPHLYPPLIHFLMLIFYKLNLSVLTIARLFEFIIYPATLATFWWLVKRLFNIRLAFFTLLICLSIYSFYLSIINFIPASLAMILAMFSLIFMERGKILASTILLGLTFYTHAGISWFFLSVFILYSLFNKKIFRSCIKVVIFSFVMALPILIYQYSFRKYLSLSTIAPEFPLEINLWLILLFMPGLVISFKQKERYSFFIALFIINLFSIFTNYRYRFISGQGIVGLIFLSSITLDRAYERAIDFLNKKPAVKLKANYLSIFILICFLFISPTILLKEKKLSFHMLNSTYINLIPAFRKIERPHEFTIYFPKFYQPIKESIIENSYRDDIIYCNFDYVAGIFSVLTGRATSVAMLREVDAYKDFDPIAVSRIILWIKDPDKTTDENLNFVVKRYNLKEIKETELAYIYKNQQTTAKRILPQPFLSNKLVFSMLILFIGLIAVDIMRTANKATT